MHGVITRAPEAVTLEDGEGIGGIRVFDDVLPDPVAYRAAALRLPFASVPISPGVVFHGIALAPDATLADWFAAQCPGLVPTLSFFRQSPQGQVEPNFIHTDRDMGERTAILYLTPEPPEQDGTTFYRHSPTRRTCSRSASEDEFLDEWQAWRDRTQWAPRLTVRARFNRAVIFPAALFHSRAIDANYGAGDEARLIQVVFGREGR